MTMKSIEDLIELMERLRDPENGCPWDQEQTFATIAPYTIEEAYEVADSIHHNDMEGLKSELGDLLFQVVFHARMAEEQGAFNFSDVVTGIVDKMERRHPHVFGDAVVGSVDEQSEEWEKIKSAEKGGAASALDGVTLALPSLVRAEKLQRRASRVGFDWPDISGAIDKCHEELDEIKEALPSGDAAAIESEIGDMLFAVVNVARFAAVDAEMALADCNRRFTRRFQSVEAQAVDAGKKLEEFSLQELDSMWEEAKRRERADDSM